MDQKKLWTRDELMIAMNIYCKVPFGQFYKGNNFIIKVAQKLQRTPSSLAMKLGNLASLDQSHQKRGVKGLSGSSKADKAIWQEFTKNWEKSVLESEEKFQALMADEETEVSDLMFDDDVNETERDFKIITEKEVITKARIGQRFFRESVLSSYNYQCCITGNPVPELLIASHIIPWSQQIEHRLNPENGLCLNCNHDAAFDKGLITFDEDYRLILSPYLMQFSSSKAIENDFIAYRGQQITFPQKFAPNPNFLQYHRESIFKAS